MQLVSIVRYPVKSLQGEELSTAEVESDGLRGDRRWGIRDEATGRILTARRAPQLLFAAARHWFGERAALVAAGLATLTGVFTFDRSSAAMKAFAVPHTSYIVVVGTDRRVVYTGVGDDQDIDAVLAKLGTP